MDDLHWVRQRQMITPTGFFRTESVVVSLLRSDGKCFPVEMPMRNTWSQDVEDIKKSFQTDDLVLNYPTVSDDEFDMCFDYQLDRMRGKEITVSMEAL